MSTTAIAFAGETLDALVWRATGAGAAAVEATLQATPGLVDHALALPEGMQVTIPNVAIAAPEGAELVQLWD